MRINKNALHSFFLALGYGIAFYILHYVFHQRDIVWHLPDSGKMLHWDANWYHSIVERGYDFFPHGSNSGFFILFPLIWKMLCLNPWTVSLLNLVFFSTAFAVFNSIYKLDRVTQFLWLTIPSFYFTWIPYSEAIFMLLSTLAMWAIARDKKYVLWLSLVLLSLTRPVTLILVPAFLIAELMTNDNKKWLLSLKTFVVNYAFPLLTGLAIFVWYQYYETGVWFAYFKQQAQHWGHKFAMPVLPFNSMNGPKLLWLNAIALFIGFVALLLLIKYCVRWLMKNHIQHDKLFVVSCLYFTGISLTTILFNPTWGTSTTNVYDIHRYAFVTPFFWVLMHRFTIINTYKPWHYLAILLLSNVFWLTFEHYQHIRYFLYFNFASVFVIMYMLLSDKRISWMPLAVAAINLILQVTMFQWFLANISPG